MSRLLMAFAAGALVLLPVGCQKVELKEFSPDGSFKVLMPEKKEEKSQTTMGAQTKIWASEFNDGALLVAVTDVGKGTGAGAMLDAMAETTLKESQKGALSAVKGELISESAIKLADKYHGRQFEAKVKVPKKSGGGEIDGIVKQRIYLVNGKLFQLQAIGKPDWVNGEEIPKFLDSLQILKEESGPKAGK